MPVADDAHPLPEPGFKLADAGRDLLQLRLEPQEVRRERARIFGFSFHLSLKPVLLLIPALQFSAKLFVRLAGHLQLVGHVTLVSTIHRSMAGRAQAVAISVS